MHARKEVTTVFVAMSGGVDSSVVAALLKQRGFRVVGVFMKPWQPAGFSCMWHRDREDALRVASVLDIPLETWDFSHEYKKKVTRYMLDGYRRGMTPNPDVMCNKEIKFGFFFERARKEGADYIATGHYAQTKNGKLFKAKDTNKDQTYFLWTLSHWHLERTLFPVGDMTKPQVRALAKRLQLPVFDKKDSQGVCFVGQLDVKDFLKSHIKPRQGKIVHVDGCVIGEHDGAYFYTIGQRHGLDIRDGGGPYFVVSKDVKKNVIVVGTERDLMRREVHITDVHWIGGIAPKFPARVMVKIRYRTPSASATLSSDLSDGKACGRLVFTRPQRAITPGQSAVFYRGRTILGGGIIK
jgi:tRNA-specific 2-thiouridylase